MAHDEKTSSRLLEPLKGAAEAESIQENRTDPSSMKKIELWDRVDRDKEIRLMDESSKKFRLPRGGGDERLRQDPNTPRL